MGAQVANLGKGRSKHVHYACLLVWIIPFSRLPHLAWGETTWGMLVLLSHVSLPRSKKRNEGHRLLVKILEFVIVFDTRMRNASVVMLLPAPPFESRFIQFRGTVHELSKAVKSVVYKPQPWFVGQSAVPASLKLSLQPGAYHGIPLYTMVYHGIPWYTIVYHGIPWYTMVYHGIPWYTMVYHGVPWYTMVYHGIPWYTMVYDGIPWNTMEYHGIPWNTMEYHGIPWNTMEYHGIPWNTMEYHGIIPWNTMEYHGIP